MNVTTETVEEIRELVSNNQAADLNSANIQAVSVAAALELACCRAEWQEDIHLTELLNCWATQSPVLSLAFRTLDSGIVPAREDIFGSRKYEFFPIAGRPWDDNEHHLFESRFTKSVRDTGFGGRASALAGAFSEMADNIIQHSGLTSSRPATGLLGYHVVNGAMSYAVGDVGRGVLASLRENPKWRGLENSVDAIDAVVVNHASRRPLGGEGAGFKQLFRSLADLNGHLTLRSGNGFMVIEGTPVGRQSKSGFATQASGFQISVTCSLLGQPQQFLI